MTEMPDELELEEGPMTGADPDGETGYGPAESAERAGEARSEEDGEGPESTDYDPDGETDSITGDEFFPGEGSGQTDETK